MPGKVYSAVKDLLIDTKGMLIKKWWVPVGTRTGKNHEQDDTTLTQPNIS